MSYLSTHHLSFGHQPGLKLLDDVTFAIDPGDRIGLAGVNGCGKTTLLRLLCGELEPSAGQIKCRNGLALYYMRRPDPECVSSGQQTREALAEAMRADADIYLLDEPTNHLDVDARNWLANWLIRRRITSILVSHDRAFLNDVTTRTLWIERSRVSLHEGCYDDALEERARTEGEHRDAYDAQQRRITAAERAAQQRDRLSAKVEKAPPGVRLCRDFYGRKAGKVARTGRILRERRQLEETKTKPWEEQPIPDLDFGNVPPAPALVLHTSSLQCGYTDPVAASPIDIAVHRSERWSITGPNGSGKTTLFKTVLSELQPLSGEFRWSAGVQPGYYDQEHQQLNLSESPVESCLKVCANETAVRTMLGCLKLRADLALMPLHTMSMGERSKTALTRLLLGGYNVLILDEPTNHLEMEAQAALASALKQFPGAVLFATHDRWFSDATATHHLELQSRSR